MGICAISFSTGLLLVVSNAVSSPYVVNGTYGFSVTLPCDGSAYSGLPDDQLDVLWQTVDGEKVARYSRGVRSLGSSFSNRVAFHPDIRHGNFSITINSVYFSDEDSYECVWSNGQGEKKFLNDVILFIFSPPFPTSLSVHVGDSVTLPCYGHVNKHAPENLFVQWKRGDEPVLNRSSEGVAFGPKYDRRASLSFKTIQKGNFSLSLHVTGLCDEGVYQCSTDQNRNVTSILLELQDYGHFTPVNLSVGKAFTLSLPEEPVRVIFSRKMTFPEVSLCSRDADEFRCELKYKNRMELKSHTLTMLNVTSDDMGIYTVMQSKNCVICHAYRVSIMHSNTTTNARNRQYLAFPILLTIAVLCILCIAYSVRRFLMN